MPEEPFKISDSIADMVQRGRRFHEESARLKAEQAAQEQQQRDRAARHRQGFGSKCRRCRSPPNGRTKSWRPSSGAAGRCSSGTPNAMRSPRRRESG